MGLPGSTERSSPYHSAEDRISGRIACGIPKNPSSSSSHASVAMFMSIVRLALVTSVMWRPPAVPPVRFQISQDSMVPNRMSPFAARCVSPGVWSKSQRIRGAEK